MAPRRQRSPGGNGSNHDGSPARSHRFRFQSFKPKGGDETWNDYKRRLDQALAHQGYATEEEKCALLTCSDPAMYRLMVALCYPLELEGPEVTYTSLTATLAEQFVEDVSEAMAEFLFEQRTQRAGESAADWLADLRQLAIPCKFRAEDLSRRLRAQLIRGVADKGCQQKLLEEPDLTLQKAIATIRTQARCKAESEALNKKPSHAAAGTSHAIAYVNNAQSTSRSDCSRCGGSHAADTCWAKDVECRECGKKGHIQRKCRSGAKANNNNRGRGRKPKPNNNNQGQSGNQAQQRIVNMMHTATGGTSGPAVASSAGGAGAAGAAGGSHPTGVGNRSSTAGTVAAYAPGANAAAWEYGLFQIRSGQDYPGPDLVRVLVDGIPFECVLDNGAPCGMMSLDSFTRHWPESRLEAEAAAMSMWAGTPVQGLRHCEVTVRVGQQEEKLPLLVADGQGPFLMGRLWLDKLGFRVSGPVRITRPEYRSVCVSTLTAEATGTERVPEKDEFECFRPGLGKYRGPKMHISPGPGVKPIYLRARPVPFAKQARIEAELKRLVDIGVLTPADQSDWATPIVTVDKSDGKLRICGDYRSTVNTVVKPEGYPLPTLDQAFAKLAGGVLFSKLDLTMAYNQVEVDESTSALLTINTHKGLFRVNRLWFGVNVAPPRFQRLIDGLMADLEGVVVLLDDILVSGRNREEHDHRLRGVLRRLSKAGLRIHPFKSRFRVARVHYLGHEVSADGLAPLQEKVVALHHAPAPQDVSQVKSFLGKVNFYQKFIPRRVELLEPLTRLLSRDAPWHWGDEQSAAFLKVKQILCSDLVLVHYSLDLPLVLSVDASPYGVGAVLAHIMPDGTERPVAYASRTLTPAEKNYAQFDKEGLAVVFGVLKFHQYVAGRTFVVWTDHKPLVGLFKSKTPAVTSPRILRWLLTLSAYSFEVKYRPGHLHGNADCLSRLPIEGPREDPPDPPMGYVHYLDLQGNRRDDLPAITAADIAVATASDPGLSQVLTWARDGWPKQQPAGEAGDFWRKREQISITRGCLLWGERVVVPPSLRQDALDRLHSTHPGVVRSKSMARTTFWWPRLDADIEAQVAACQVCQLKRANPPKAPYQPWPKDRPWGRIHLDFGEPRQGEYFLVAVDAETKWMEAWWVPNTSTESVINCLSELFAKFGDPDLIVSDNGTAFTSGAFQQFLADRGIRQLTIAVGCSWSNGLAERAVRTIKEALQRVDGTRAEPWSRATPR